MVDPVAILVRGNSGPRNGFQRCAGDNSQFLRPCEVVTDVPVIELALIHGTGLLHQYQDCDGGAAAGIKDLPALSSALLAGGPLIAPQIEDVDLVKL